MRIAHVTATFPPYYAGTGVVCYHNALGLARLGHEVTVFTSRHSNGNYADPEEFTVCRMPALFRIGNAPFLPGLVRLRDFDIIHLHHPFIFGAELIWALSKVRSIPYVMTHHNDLVGDGIRRYLFDTYTAAATPLVLNGAQRFAAVTLDHAASCRLSPLLEKRWEHVVEIPNGVDTDRFRPGLDGRPIRRRHGVSDDVRIVLFVGALDRAHHFKGVDHLLHAFSEIKRGDSLLMIVGEGDLKAQFMALAGRLGIAQRICFVGAVSHSQLAPYYAAADIVVLPSFPPESFGVVLIEAMSCGRPVVAHDIPGVRSVVGDGVDGLLARPGETSDLVAKIEELLENPLRCRRMGELGRAKAEAKYAWPKVVARLAELYEEVLATASRDCAEL